MKNLLILFCSLLILADLVFGADDVVSRKEGDSVTLEIVEPVEKNGASDLRQTESGQSDWISHHHKHHISTQWSLSATDQKQRKDKTQNIQSFCHCVGVATGVARDMSTEARASLGLRVEPPLFTNIKVNQQTGDLNIRNIRRDQSGEYKMEIKGGSFILHKTFRINVSGEVKSVSVMEGDYVTLHTNLTRIQRDDVVQWRFKDSLIAHSDETTKNILHNDSKGRFTGRLEVNWAGSLIITNITSGDSGLYEVNITGSKIIHKRFDVTVTESSRRSNGEKTGPGLLVVLILMGIIVIL